MADPWQTLSSNMFSLPGVMSAASDARKSRLQEMMLGRQMAQEEKTSAAREKATSMYRSGDRKGARDEAITGGAYDLADALGKMDTAEQERVKQRLSLVGEAALWADTPEKWDQSIDYLVEAGHPDLAQYRGKFSPAARQAAIAAAGQSKEFFERNKPLVGRPGDWIMDPNDPKRVLQRVPHAPWRTTLAPGQTLVGGQEGGATGFPGGFDAFHSGFLAGAEGGYNPKDPMSGAPVNFGIDQRANPDIDVKNLTPEQARQIMHDRYWVPSGADQIENPALQAVHADTAVNMGVTAAKGLLEKSGGDPAKYLQLREQRYREIGGPALNGWLNRNRKLAEFIGLGGGGARILATGEPKPQGRVVTNPEGLPPGTYWINPDGKPDPITPPKPAGQGGKAIPASTETKVSEQFDIYSSLQRAADNWKPDYGGNTIMGEAENIAQRIFGTGTPGQAEWWADFQTTDNLIRNSMFGAALTATEKAAYEKTTVSPRMDPRIIETRIAKRRDIIQGALRRRARTLAAQGYNPEAISAMFGDDPALIQGLVGSPVTSTPPASNRQSPPSSAPRRLKYNPATGRLE